MPATLVSSNLPKWITKMNPNLGQLQIYSDQDRLNDFKGEDFSYLQDILKKGIEGNEGLFDTLLGNAKRKIGAVTDRNIQDISEQSAQSGFRGIGANKINDAYKTEAEAVGGVADNLATQELGWKQNMIGKLLGLNQFEGGVNMNLFQSNRDQANFNRQMDYQEDQSDNWLGQLLGNILGAGSQVGTAALLMSDKKLKENIKEVGETKSGIPIVEFNYKGDPDKTKIRGHLAQQVEKIFPKAVVKAINYEELPQDAVFEILN